MSRERRLYAFFAACYLAQGLGGIAYEPVGYLMKDVLGLGPGAAAAMVAWTTLPLTLKPLFGLLTDLLPWAGRRRAPHLVAVSLLTTAAWAALALSGGYRYGPVLLLLTLVNVGYVLSDVVCDGVMVERGREKGASGPYQAVQIGTLYLTMTVTGLGGGWLAAHASYRTVFLLAAAFPVLSALAARWIDEPGVGGVPETAARGARGLLALARSRRAWAVAAAIFLLGFTPFLGTAQFYYQSEALGLSPVFIGALSTLSGVAGVAGAGLFARLSARAGGAERVARWSVPAAAALSLLNVFYLGRWPVAALTVLFSLAGVAFRLAWMDLAARASPEGAEATAFAAFMAVFNLTAAASNTAGGVLYERLAAAHGAYPAMLLLTAIGTAATLLAWPLLRWAAPRS